MLSWGELIGFGAAVFTTVSYIPQLQKCWKTGSAGDLSLYMYLVLSAGLGLWIVYGFIQADLVIVAANAVSLALLACIIGFKIRDMWRARSKGIRGKAAKP